MRDSYTLVEETQTDQVFAVSRYTDQRFPGSQISPTTLYHASYS